MSPESPVALISRLSKASLGVFLGGEANGLGVSRNQIAALCADGVIERILPNTYRMTAIASSRAQALRAALLWAGPEAVAAGRSAAELYGLDGVTSSLPEITLPRSVRARSSRVIVHQTRDPSALMIRQQRGVRCTGVEATLLALAATLDAEPFEIACEDARRRKLTSVPSLRSYLRRYGRPGKPGVSALRDLLDEIDPAHPARSVLEVKTRRLLVAHGIEGFVREFPLVWAGRTYLFDFAFVEQRTIFETNGRRWHDDANDYEYDNEKWSVPGRHGYRVVFATWDKVTRCPAALLAELEATLAA